MKLKIFPFIVFIIVGVGVFWLGSGIFTYFTHNKNPDFVLEGIQDQGVYKGNLSCSILSNSEYKVAMVSSQLDGKEIELPSEGKVRAKQFSTSFFIDTTTLTEGPHILEVEAVDSSYNQNRTKKSICFFVDNVPLKAAFLDTQYTVDQGKTIHMKIKTNKRLRNASISFLTQTYQCFSEPLSLTMYESFIPVECEETPGEQPLVAELCDEAGNTMKLTAKAEVVAFQFKKQKQSYNITRKLDEEKEISMNNKILEEAIQKWKKDSPCKKLWAGPFEIPTQVQRIVTPHGEIRVTPERGRYMHKGIDLVNSPKSVVWASQHGKVIIKDRYLLTGNTVVLDHGLGVNTLYAHLENFADIEVGDEVKKGNPVGRIGKTGYATGYHLHWELRVGGVAVDPVEWTKTVF